MSKDVITNEYITEHFSGTNYGHENYRAIIEQGCLKVLAGYRNGYTTTTILIEMGLITKKPHELTQRGREFLFQSFSRNAPNGRLADKLAEYENMEPVAWVMGDEEIDDFNRGYEVQVMRDCSDSFDCIPLYRHPNK
ncbi:hypothetical protein PSI22_21115 [Xenorhabdus sp. XENO-7]|uniref:Uncharacterized protein n=1 Tax=Xenorhabdus aichiensis TaxID=3025874 RepID=A0ABT5MAQ1_9GAMM|nr:hypothetical protein [Xenorhabdus aichiensis]MDC9624058.1 hypothetical protein [Xenorhabdus aichiensis]